MSGWAENVGPCISLHQRLPNQDLQCFVVQDFAIFNKPVMPGRVVWIECHVEHDTDVGNSLFDRPGCAVYQVFGIDGFGTIPRLQFGVNVWE